MRDLQLTHHTNQAHNQPSAEPISRRSKRRCTKHLYGFSWLCLPWAGDVMSSTVIVDLPLPGMRGVEPEPPPASSTSTKPNTAQWIVNRPSYGYRGRLCSNNTCPWWHALSVPAGATGASRDPPDPRMLMYRCPRASTSSTHAPATMHQVVSTTQARQCLGRINRKHNAKRHCYRAGNQARGGGGVSTPSDTAD